METIAASRFAESEDFSLGRSRARALAHDKILIAVVLLALLGLGIGLRIFPSSGFHGVGFDEHGYEIFVRQIQKAGWWNYDAVVHVYLERQSRLPDAVVPATRIGYLLPAAVTADVFHLDPLPALKLISCLTSIGLLFATSAIAYRHGGPSRMLVMTALIAVAPLQIALAQRALVDGCFAFWAVLTAWFFWEAWQAPHVRGWVAAYGGSLFVLILTKENAAFVFLALAATAGTLCLCEHHRPNVALFLMSLASPALALFFLASLMGGLTDWVSFYRMFGAKSSMLPYAIHMQDGAWYRYLIDFAVVSPCIVALVFGRIFQLERTAKCDFFWALFLGFSFAAMACVPNGMSLRFAAYWDVPLRWLAASQLIALAPRIWPRRAAVALALMLAFCLTIDLSQYARLFVAGGIYDPVSAQLFHASRFWK